MKFISIVALLPLSILTQNSGVKLRASFTTEGIANALNVVAHSRQGDPAKLKEQASALLQRNPKILESFLVAAGKPEHSSARDKALKFYGEISSGIEDPSKLPTKAIDFIYNNPDVQRLVLAGVKEVKKAYPTIVDDFFTAFDKTIRANPALLTQLKAASVKFSRTEPKAFKEANKLAFKLAAYNTRSASQYVIRLIQADKYGCGAKGLGGCQCQALRVLPEFDLFKNNELPALTKSLNDTSPQEEKEIDDEFDLLSNSL